MTGIPPHTTCSALPLDLAYLLHPALASCTTYCTLPSQLRPACTLHHLLYPASARPPCSTLHQLLHPACVCPPCSTPCYLLLLASTLPYQLHPACTLPAPAYRSVTDQPTVQLPNLLPQQILQHCPTVDQCTINAPVQRRDPLLRLPWMLACTGGRRSICAMYHIVCMDLCLAYSISIAIIPTKTCPSIFHSCL